MTTETTNAKIQSTTLGLDDHGILTCWLHLSWEGSGAGFGGRHWNARDEPVASLASFIEHVLDTVGVESWEKLPGRYIRIEHDGTQVQRIGHLIENKWFDPAERKGTS